MQVVSQLPDEIKSLLTLLKQHFDVGVLAPTTFKYWMFKCWYSIFKYYTGFTCQLGSKVGDCWGLLSVLIM